MSSLEQRLTDAVSRHIPADFGNRYSSGQPNAVTLRYALVAGLSVIADELRTGPEPSQPVAAPERALPVTLGSVILVTAIDGDDLDHLAPAMRDDEPDDCAPWHVATHERGVYLDAARLSGWIPARVVRDDERGPVAALNAILSVLDMQPKGLASAVHDAMDAATAALATIEGTTP